MENIKIYEKIINNITDNKLKAFLWQEGSTKYKEYIDSIDLTIEKNCNDLTLTIIKLIQTYRSAISNSTALILNTKKKLTVDDFHINSVEKIENYINLLDLKFSSFNYKLGIHILSFQFDHIKTSDFTSKQNIILPFISNINYIHLFTIHNNPELFEVITTSKNTTYCNPLLLLNLNKAYNNYYIPTPNYNKSLLSFKKSKFKNVIPDLLKYNIETGAYSPTNLIMENIDYTFGLEIETCKGKVPDLEYIELNASCIYDGSLKDEDGIAAGGEYVTGVLRGDAGINQLRKLVNLLVERNCKVNDKCSVHVHIGSCNFNKENLLSMYLLGTMLESEIFSLFPNSRFRSTYCRPLNKIFSNEDLAKLSEIDSMNEVYYKKYIDYLFDLKLYPYVRDGIKIGSKLNENLSNFNVFHPTSRFNKLSGHPGGNKCGYDKNAQRYCWLNFVTCLFNNRGVQAKTLEFRIHNGTLNFKKILAWLKICMAITWFAENHKKSVYKGYYIDNKGNKEAINLSLILKLAFPKNHKILVDYLEERKKLFNDKQRNDKLEEEQEYQESLNIVKSFKLKELLQIN